MESALIVSCSEKNIAFFVEILNEASVNEIITLESAGKARRLLLEQDPDLVIVNSPPDESGEKLSRHIAAKGLSQVMLVVKGERFDTTSAACENDGILTISEPLNKAVVGAALRLAGSAQSRLRRMRDENNRLKQKIEDIRIIDRAKCLLISYLNMSEKEAHRYIEKQAMDIRSTKRAVAERILKTYAN